MRNIRSLLFASLVGGSLFYALPAAAQVHVEARTYDHGAVVVVNPRTAPPPIRVEAHTRRAGYVWAAGSWEWRGGRWQWMPGHYDKLNVGKRWRAPEWRENNGEWVQTPGEWIVADPAPRAAPPPPQDEHPRARPGWLWVTGHWDWQDGDWAWTGGRWERQRVGYKFNEGRWENRGGTWTWVDGTWAAPPEFPSEPPPAPRVERPVLAAGQVWLPGAWAWDKTRGEYTWEKGHASRPNPGHHWTESRWENKDGKWVRANGEWIEDGRGPGPGPGGAVQMPPGRPGVTGGVNVDVHVGDHDHDHDHDHH